jgi:hypothetical protein
VNISKVYIDRIAVSNLLYKYKGQLLREMGRLLVEYIVLLN